MKFFYAIVIFFTFALSFNLQAAYIQNQPYQITQPDGTKIQCFVSGDEFFNWLHDADGYTIIQAEDGYFYYAVHDKERIVASEYLVESVNPFTAGLTPWIKISKQEYQLRKQSFEIDNPRSTRAPHSGTFNNLAVYIRFAGDSEFNENRQHYDNIFNLGSGNSVKTYYDEVSYNMLNVSTSHYPVCAMTTNLSYTDSHPRKYFEPYNATTNPGGYNGMDERTFREHTLLVDAINWINANSPVPPSLNIDGDNDGYVDNVAFIIRGGNGAWNSLLWAHRWALYTQTVYINNKRVWDFTFQPETQVNVKTLCHEFFHALGAPDLYHYDDGGLNIAPVGPWDIMESGGGHMGAYMKWKYSGNTWISSIPEITSSGTYTLNPLTSSSNNCYKIASPNSTSQYFVVEYRQNTGSYESNLPGSGLVVYRIDPTLNGNADGPPDEVYIYRPNGTTTNTGSISNAHFSQQSGQTAINDGTNPSSFLQNGNPGGLNIYDVTATGSTISFKVGFSSIENPGSFAATAVSENQINLQWLQNTAQNNVMLAYNTANAFGSPADGTSYSSGNSISGGGNVLYAGNAQNYQHKSLDAGTQYYYKIWSVDNTKTYSNGVSASAHTNCGSQTIPFNESFNGITEIPVCWNQQMSGNNVMENWSFSPTNFAGGNTGELKSSWQQVSPGINRIILPAFNTTGMSNLNLSFRHMLDAYSTGTTLRVQSSSNGNTWTNEAWAIQSSSSDIGPEEINTTITSNLNSLNTYIAFTVEGNLYNYDHWYIDNISVTNNTILAYNISTTSNPVVGGTTSGGGTYNQGTQVTVIATANTGYTFTNWTESGNVVSSSANYTFTVQDNRSLVANFTIQAYNISTASNPVAGGTTSGGGTYNQGTQITVIATANTGYTFTNWTESGNVVSSSANYAFTVQGNRSLVANFTIQSYNISTTSNPVAGGTTSGEGTYNQGTQVTVIATDNTGYTFNNWTENGNVVSNSANYAFTVQGNRSLVANFNIQTYNISTTSNPDAGGTTSGGGTYNQGTQATVIATANTGYTFNNWTENGNVVSNSANYAFTVQGNRSLAANFNIQTYNISTTSNPVAGGTTSGGGTYNQGTQITVIATANTGYTFTNWTEDGNVVSSSANYAFTVQGNRSLVANFNIQTFSIQTSSNPSEGGITTGAGIYIYGETVELTATANQNYTFVEWKENENILSTEQQISIVVNEDRELVAHFKLTVEVVELSKPACKLYPNPGKEVCFIETNDAAGRVVGISIIGITGNVIMDIKQPSPVNILQIDLSAMAESVYFIKIITEKGHCITKKLILRK